ncbi:adenylyl cyclase-associated protein 1 [Latimeria chalumnae]|uniref:Adenylyl cyclase-associated protein n=1 Tax=Latimeria chalumnae TaxID=7897 RepID=H3B558_LATCH|nr:PREDICTED: adenylyl cyclase-associated protein 1 [Latimeria chalumnae]XP_005993963.1 PREDICTED: adenylyl cyclase-associated protein 1 [Latimeria chalumnae]|eukprot:XP_005993962.1 PREDICTED: adenylyl cyclase-associated protein 1 [Latimeria chalumnae]
MSNMQGLVERLEKAVGRLELMAQSGGIHGGGSEAGGDAAPYVEAFDAQLSGPVSQYLKLSKEIGGDVQVHAEMVSEGLKLQRCILVMASRCQKPGEKELMELLKPLSSKIQQVQDFRERNRGSKVFNHLSAISESVMALNWVAVAPKPGPFVKEMMDAAMFYTNRVLKDYKDTNKKHVEWVKAYLNIWIELQAYIKEHHTTGVAWNKTGPKALIAAAAPAVGAPPPPPPGGPPPPPAGPLNATQGDSSVSRSALFADLNQGDTVTKGLKHVSDDQKTHKNPTLRGQSPQVRSGPRPFPVSKPGAGAPAPAKKAPPVLELDGKKWRVENHENASNLVIEDTQLKQVVYAYKCLNSTLQVKGKINSITLDNCKKTGLVFDDVVGIVEVINCRDIKIQVLSKVPTISINKTDGCHVYLSKDSLSCEIISAKSSEMNVLVPKDDDFSEFPIPEQFKTVWNGQKLVTTVTEIAG